MKGNLYPVAMLVGLAVSGCTSTNLPDALGTLKNPYPTLARPYQSRDSTGAASADPFVQRNYDILLRAAEPSERGATVSSTLMREYLAAGFALSDIYCDAFFRDADESQRRRRYGRGVTNDVGTAIAAILGLANAGENLVTGVATSFGLADNLWRNYDEAFVVSPSLSNVKTLVKAAQDKFRELTLGKEAEKQLPADYGTAQSVVLRYADFCSTLGMQSLLNISAEQQQRELNKDTANLRSDKKSDDDDKKRGDGDKSESEPPSSILSVTSNNADGDPERRE